MYLFPTEKELRALWSEIDPKQRVLRAMHAAVDEACRLNRDSMAAFYTDGQDCIEDMEDYCVDIESIMEFKGPPCPSVDWDDI